MAHPYERGVCSDPSGAGGLGAVTWEADVGWRHHRREAPVRRPLPARSRTLAQPPPGPTPPPQRYGGAPHDVWAYIRSAAVRQEAPLPQSLDGLHLVLPSGLDDGQLIRLFDGLAAYVGVSGKRGTGRGVRKKKSPDVGKAHTRPARGCGKAQGSGVVVMLGWGGMGPRGLEDEVGAVVVQQAVEEPSLGDNGVSKAGRSRGRLGRDEELHALQVWMRGCKGLH
jgi:hypothetical protein